MMVDVVVVGAGIAGLEAALEASKKGCSVAVLSKTTLMRSSSAVASGGINGVLDDPTDSIQHHIDDTLKGGDGICSYKSVKVMCERAKEAILDLDALGVTFAKDDAGNLKQRPFGGTKAKRTCFSSDTTGSAIIQKLMASCRREGVTFVANCTVLDLAVHEGRVSGVIVLMRGESRVEAIGCKAVVLATGGYAGIYRGHTTNAQENSGDALVIALKAGLTLSNMEFVQFHPTTLPKSGSLISEASRGEGATIVDETGERFVDELLTRDKLSQAILTHQEKGHKVFLDFRHLSHSLIDERLPSTKKIALFSAGVDIATELLPITVSAHYTMGGIVCDTQGRTSLSNLFVCGEVASNGVHGANRLGGNSLLEGAVFGKIVGKECAKEAEKNDYGLIDYRLIAHHTKRVTEILEGENRFNLNAMRTTLGECMFTHAGVFRMQEGLEKGLNTVHYLMGISRGLHCINKERENNVELASILEYHNALIVAEAVIVSSLKRKESRGAFYRRDFPKKCDCSFHSPSYVKRLNESYLRVTYENKFIVKLKNFISKLKD